MSRRRWRKRNTVAGNLLLVIIVAPLFWLYLLIGWLCNGIRR